MEPTPSATNGAAAIAAPFALTIDGTQGVLVLRCGCGNYLELRTELNTAGRVFLKSYLKGGELPRGDLSIKCGACLQPKEGA